LHPEFGLLCPSQSLRRKTRRVLAFLVIAGLLAWTAAHPPATDGARVVAHDDETRFNAEAAPAIGETTAATPVDSPRPFERSRIACTGDAWSYFDGTCSVGTARRSPRPRAANEAPTIAALPVGHGVRPAHSAPPAPASSVALLSATDADPAESKPAVADRADAPAPAPPPKKVKKPAPRNNGNDLAQDRRWRDDQWSARAYAYPDDRYLRGRYERWSGWDQVRHW